MGNEYTELNDDLREFIAQQRMFFVATAPLAAEGHINVSPKGLDSLRVLAPRSVAYLDLTGSGIETVAHTRENGRITILLCAFAGRPRIVRLYGRGRAVLPGDPEWSALAEQFPRYTSTRSIVVIELERIADSCGFGVPRYEFVEDRTQLVDWADKKGRAAIEAYQVQNNQHSIDGLPGLPAPSTT
jgi:hypothetical protein